MTNGFRVAGTGIAAHHFGPEAAQGFFHEFSGWLVFVAAFALMIGLQQLIVAALASAVPLLRPLSARPFEESDMLRRAIVLFVMLLCGAAGVVRANRPEHAPPRTSFETFPDQLGGWKGQQLPRWTPRFSPILGVDDYMSRAYFRAGSRRSRVCTSATTKASGRETRSTRRRIACQAPAGNRRQAVI